LYVCSQTVNAQVAVAICALEGTRALEAACCAGWQGCLSTCKPDLLLISHGHGATHVSQRRMCLNDVAAGDGGLLCARGHARSGGCHWVCSKAPLTGRDCWCCLVRLPLHSWCRCPNSKGESGYNYELLISGLSACWLVLGRVSISNMYCIVLYCIVLYCIVLYCIVLYCIVLYCIVLYCIVLYCIVSAGDVGLLCSRGHARFRAATGRVAKHI
jgi:hypothetical protein